MKNFVKSPTMLAWVSVTCTILACQLGGGGQAQDSEAETPVDSGSQPLAKSTPTTGGVPIQPTLEPTAPPAPTQAPPGSTPPSGGGSTASAQVLTSTEFVTSDGVFHVIGVIVNDGAFPIWQIAVQYDVLDQQGVVMDTVTGYPGYQILFPGEITPFEAEFVDPFPREVGDVQVSLQGEAMSLEEVEQNGYLNSLTHACEVVQVEGRPPSFGDYEVAGEVRNTADLSVINFGVSLMVFDAADNLLGVYVHIVPDKYVMGQGILLTPGETTTFTGWFSSLAEGGEPARIEVGCEGEKTP